MYILHFSFTYNRRSFIRVIIVLYTYEDVKFQTKFRLRPFIIFLNSQMFKPVKTYKCYSSNFLLGKVGRFAYGITALNRANILLHSYYFCISTGFKTTVNTVF